jgi:5-formyltetrahydrofolate cyclo-ligase
MLFVPLLGFTRLGARLGYGAGYYDAALRSLRKQGAVTAIGAAFDEQEFEAIPHDSHDELLDFVLTPSRIIRCGE